MKRQISLFFLLLLFTSCSVLHAFKRHLNGDESDPQAVAVKKTERAPAAIAAPAPTSRETKKRSPWASIQDDRLASLWSDHGQDNFYFSRNVRRRSGDVFLLKAGSELNDVTLSRIENYFKKQKKTSEKPPEPKADGEAAPAAAAPPPEEPIQVSLGDIPMKLDRELPLGAFEVRGEKSLFVRDTRFVVQVTGKVKMEDIGPDDSLISSRLMDGQIVVKK